MDTNFIFENRKGRDNLEDQDLDKKVILISLKEIEYGSMD
jgi:hypothetical protein